MLYLVIGLLIAAAAYAAYSAKTPEGWDPKKGLAAVVALICAVWAYVSGLFTTPPV
jgi:ABC-type transport system involved in cytochrome c biogenesis permease subunit